MNVCGNGRSWLWRLSCVAALFALCALGQGCCEDEPGDGPPSGRTSSASFETLAEKVAFVERHVTFRRTYKGLDFNIFFQNNGGGMLPGPSDWDVRLRATVPVSEIDDWIGGLSRADAPVDISWTQAIPGGREPTEGTAFFANGGVILGVDRERGTVFYRNTTLASPQ